MNSKKVAIKYRHITVQKMSSRGIGLVSECHC